MHPSRVTLRLRDGQLALFARVAIPAGEMLSTLPGVVRPHPSRHSVQVGRDVHVEAPGPNDATVPSRWCWKFLNHSCEPSGLVSVQPQPSYVTARDLERGEELTFDYLTTEWDLAEPFACECGSSRCHGVIAGFAHLSSAAQQSLLPEAAPHHRELLGAANATGRSL